MGAAAIITVNKDDSSNDTLDIPFPKDGLKLSFVREFLDFCGGPEKLLGLTTTEVCRLFVKPATESSKLSFCDWLKQQNHPSVGKGEVFISHAWKFKFLDVTDALQYHFADKPDIIIWFDMFSNNQHKAVDLDFNWCCNTFKSTIQDFSYTVMV